MPALIPLSLRVASSVPHLEVLFKFLFLYTTRWGMVRAILAAVPLLIMRLSALLMTGFFAAGVVPSERTVLSGLRLLAGVAAVAHAPPNISHLGCTLTLLAAGVTPAPGGRWALHLDWTRTHNALPPGISSSRPSSATTTHLLAVCDSAAGITPTAAGETTQYSHTGEQLCISLHSTI